MVNRRKSAARISRNKKKYWRRGANVTEVEAFLDEKRADERLEAHFKSLTQDHPVFVIDKTPNSAARVAVARETASTQERHKGSKRGAKNLPLLTTLPQRTGPFKKSEKPSQRWNSPQFFDLWNEGVQNAAFPIPSFEAGDQVLKDYYLRGRTHGFSRVPKTMRVPRSVRQHVEVPHAGTSYNPRDEDHQSLLKKACLAEMAKLNKEKALNKAGVLPKPESRAAKKRHMQEMTEGLFSTSEREDSPETEATDKNDNSAANVPLKPKTKAQRRRAATEKKLKARLEREKQNRVRENDIYRLRKIKKEIRRQEEASKKRQERKKLIRIKKLLAPARIGPHKFVPPEEDLLLSNELPNSLRLLKPEGSILADRYKNLQLRNIIESRIPIRKKRKCPYKYLEKSVVRCVDERYVPDNPLGINVQ